MKILQPIKEKFHRFRASGNPISRGIVLAKDFIWTAPHKTGRFFIQKHNKRKIKKWIMEEEIMPENLGLSLWGYVNFKKLLDESGKTLKIPDGINNIKIDVGLSFGAPNSAIWLEKLQDRVVFGFEPNPESVQEIFTGSNKKRGNTYKYLDTKYINQRFFLFDMAIDSDLPHLKKFYATKGDPGTSSLHKPNSFKIKKIISVPTIRLSDFLSLIPWQRFEFIEHLKIDTQGNDLRVLQSAGSYLSERIVFVTAESTTKDQYEHTQTEPELDRYMNKNGFNFVEGTKKGGNKTYINSKFKHLLNKLDYSTEGR